jgi:hypothetical protein
LIYSTIIVSITRLWALANYNNSTNPIYDNMLSGIFSPLELNVGIICMCMPAFRRFVARFAPTCFGSTFASSNRKYYEDNTTPSEQQGRAGHGRRKTDTFGGSLFQSTIVKTVDTTGEEEESGDQIRLVELNREEGGDGGRKDVPESAYQQTHEGKLPKVWRGGS